MATAFFNGAFFGGEFYSSGGAVVVVPVSGPTPAGSPTRKRRPRYMGEWPDPRPDREAPPVVVPPNIEGPRPLVIRGEEIPKPVKLRLKKPRPLPEKQQLSPLDAEIQRAMLQLMREFEDDDEAIIALLS